MSAAAAPPLTFRTKAFFGLGSMAENIALYSVTAFGLLFYNQVLGLPAHLAGLAISAGLILDGLSDPIVGSLSDRTRSRWGRRHPFMFAAPPAIGLALFAVFNPPPGLGTTGLMLWFGGSVVLLRVSMTVFHTPHLALGGELSADYNERSRVMAYNSFFTWAGGSLTYFLALQLFFPTTPAYPSGVLNPEPWPRYAASVAVCAVCVLLLSAWFTRDRIPYLPKPAPDQPPFSPREFARDVVRAMTNMNYVWLLVGFFFLSMTNGLRDVLWLYTTNFYWRLSSESQSWFVFGSFAGFLFSFFLAARFHVRFDKRPTILVAGLLYCLGPSVPFVLGLMGVLTPETPGLLPFLITWTFFTHAPISVMTISVMSALADVADENELRHGVRQEGVLYSTRALFAKVDQAIGAALAGLALTLIAFPPKAVVGAVAPEVLERLAVAYALSGVPGLVALAFYARYRIDRRSWAATREALNARKAAQDPTLELGTPVG